MQLRDDLALVLAPNATPMTYLGTNTYILGRDRVVVIDPGPDDATHLAALLRVIAGRPVDAILISHTHQDHTALAPALAASTGAPCAAFGDHRAGRSAVMAQLTAHGLQSGGEGIDRTFRPDLLLRDGQVMSGDWGRITVLHTPGHLGNHLCFCWQDAVFTGDHVMGWASSLISPPDGDLTDFMASCHRLADVPAAIYYPGHGAPVADPSARLRWLINHRQDRHTQIATALAQAPATVAQITAQIYPLADPVLARAAARNVLAHLIDLAGKGYVSAIPRISDTATFTLTRPYPG